MSDLALVLIVQVLAVLFAPVVWLGGLALIVKGAQA